MVDPIGLARGYLLVPSSLWEWSKDDGALVWRSGCTIAFPRELVEVLSRLSRGGLPPFASVAILLTACRTMEQPWQSWGSAISTPLPEIFALFQEYSRQDDLFAEQGVGLLDRQLAAINQLPAELRQSLDAKCELVAAVFEHATYRGLPNDAENMVNYLRHHQRLDQLSTNMGTTTFTRHWLRHSLESLLQGLRHFDVQSWSLRYRTSVESLPRQDSLELPARVKVRQLLDELRSDHEWGGLAKLATDLMGATYLPRPLHERQDMPLGGVSDITNRGTLDQLLLSELAHDDLTLAVRVALREALYLRREEPPRAPPGIRLFLLDSGIRLWGLPRLFAAAVALALVGVSDQHLEARVYRARGDSLDSVDLTSRDGLVQHLENLQPAPHPGAALPAFTSLIKKERVLVDAILITSADTWEDRDFRVALADADWNGVIATVDRDGMFILRAFGPRHDKILRQAQWSLDQLLERPAPPPPKQPPIPKRAPEKEDGDLPALLKLQSLPFRLCEERWAHKKRRVEHSTGILEITHDRRLVSWDHPGWGAKQWTDRIPSGTIFWFGPLREDPHVGVLAGAPPRIPMRWLVVNSAGDSWETELGVTAVPRSATVADYFLVFRYKNHIQVLDHRTATVLGELPLSPSIRHFRGRFFVDDRTYQWSILVYDGIVCSLLPINTTLPELIGNRDWQLFDRPGIDGPWAFTKNGKVISLASGETISIPLPGSVHCKLSQVSEDGNRLLLFCMAQAVGYHVFLYNLASNELDEVSRNYYSSSVSPTQAPGLRLVYWDSQRIIHLQSHRIHFRSVGFDDQGHLLLENVNYNWWRLDLVASAASSDSANVSRSLIAPSNREELRMLPLSSPPSVPTILFRRCPGPRGTRYKLREATFCDGSRVVLDSRGLLHLKSSDAKIPEMSFVLVYPSPLAAWSSENLLTGDPYYLGDSTIVNAVYFRDLLRQFAARLP